MTDKERIEKLEKSLKQSTDLLKSIRYCPEQINFNWDDTHIPQYLLNQIEENGKILMNIQEEEIEENDSINFWYDEVSGMSFLVE